MGSLAIFTVWVPRIGSVYRSSVTGCPMRFGLARLWVNVMNSHFSGSAVRPFQYSHRSTCEYPSVAESVAPRTVTDVVYIAPSSTYMVRSLRAHILVISNKLVVYIMDKMGDKGDSCGVPLVISNDSETCPPPLSMAVLEDKKDSVQAHMPGGKPLSRKICMACAGLTLSKKPEMSKRSRAPAHFAAQVAYILWTKALTASTAEWCGRDPNWVMGRRSCAWMSSFILLVTIFSRSLPAHSMREMGR
jgi:hypothetical protein